MEPSARLAIVVLVVVAASVANAAGTDSLPHMNSVAHATDDPQRIEFSQVDANNWRSVETGLCATAVRTLSRKSGLWTYHTTRTVRPNSAPCAEPGKTTTTTYDPLIGEERELRCRYWR